MLLQNVVDENGDPLEIQQHSYKYNLYKELNCLLPNFNDFLFCEYANNNLDLPPTRFYPHDKKILVLTGGERKQQYITELKQYFTHIFANYYWDEEGVTSFPLGYHNFYEYNNVPINERNYDLFFMGFLNNNRISMAAELTGINRYLISLALSINVEKTLKFLNEFLDWTRRDGKFLLTQQFGGGLEGREYCEVMRHSKIVLAPKGWVNTETFRLYEAMQYGCIVVTEELPKRKYYENIPVIQVSDWKKGFTEIKKLLKNKQFLDELSDNHKKFYDNHLSAKAAAKIFAEKLYSL